MRRVKNRAVTEKNGGKPKEQRKNQRKIRIERIKPSSVIKNCMRRRGNGDEQRKEWNGME